MKEANLGFERLKEILRKDKRELSTSFLKQIKSDLFLTLNQFFDLSIDDINLKYGINNDNQYQFNIEFNVKKTKKINYL